MAVVTKIEQCVEVVISNQNHRATSTTVATVWTPAWLVLRPPERPRPSPAFAAPNGDGDVVNEFHRDGGPQTATNIAKKPRSRPLAVRGQQELKIFPKSLLLPPTPVKAVTIYTDGACSGNPGPGGWGAILMFGEHERVITGYEAATTNNRMELMAVIAALEVMKEAVHARVHTDSAYIANAFKEDWITGWIGRGWRTSNKKPVKNRDLWERLIDLTKKHTVEFIKVKGHADDELNNRVDGLAVMALEDGRRG